MEDERFDGLYLNVAQTARGIEPLLDSVFSFLRRKTDFFSGPPGSEDGTAASIAKVNEVLQKHAERYRNDKLAAEKKKKTKQALKKTKAKAASNTKTATKTTTQPFKKEEPDNEDEIIEMSSDGGFDASTTVESKKPIITPLKSNSASASASTSTTSAKESQKVEEIPPAATKAATKDGDKKKESNDNNNDNDDDGEGPPPEGNGGIVPGKYAWTQTLAEVMVNVPVPENTRGRDVQVTITPSHLKIVVKKNDRGVVIDADLTKRIICDDSFWTIEDGNRLVVNLQKSNQMEWWDSVCQGHPIINVRHIRPENSSVSDLDGETRKTVEKMMFDQRQKALGRPTSDEQTKLDTLEMFKKQHPEMDFSDAKIS